ncbi:hypothetical protein ACOTD6_06805 [Achromobacter xylosoxidans]
MNEQNSASQPLLTGDEIRTAVHQARSMTAPSDTTEPGDYVMAGAQTMLSKLHIPVAEVSLTHRCANCGAVFQGAGCPSCRLAAPMASSPVAGALAYQLRRTDGHPLACWEDCSRQMYVRTLATGRYNGLDLGPPCEVRALGVIDAAPQVWPADAQMATLEQFIYEDMGSPSDWMGFDRDGARRALAGVSIADERAALARLEAACDTLCRLRTQEQYLSMVDSGQQDALLELDGARAQARAALASSPVAADVMPRRQGLLDAIHRYGNARAMAEHNIAYRDEVRNTADALIALFDAAPQASDEDVRNAALEEAAKLMDQTLRSNGAALIRGLKRSRADKDGGQQRAGDGKTREAVDYPRGGALNFDDPVSASAEGIRSPSNACMHRNERRAMLERQTAARNTRLRDLAAEALTWMESSTEKPVSLCADLRTVLASSSSRNSQGGIDG